MSRCDAHTYGECSCRASGIPCRVEEPATEVLKDKNKKAAKQDALALVLLATILFAIIIGLGAQAGPVNV